MGKVVKLESKQRSLVPQCTRLQSRRGRALEPSPLTPELKEFIDRAIVPVLVKQSLAVNDLENYLAKEDSDAAHFVSNAAARELRAVKP